MLVSLWNVGRLSLEDVLFIKVIEDCIEKELLNRLKQGVYVDFLNLLKVEAGWVYQ